MSKINAKEFMYFSLIRFDMLAKVCLFLWANFVNNGEFLLQVYSPLIIHFNGDRTLISSKTPFLALFYSA
jgi:hypothetical protein